MAIYLILFYVKFPSDVNLCERNGDTRGLFKAEPNIIHPDKPLGLRDSWRGSTASRLNRATLNWYERSGRTAFISFPNESMSLGLEGRHCPFRFGFVL